MKKLLPLVLAIVGLAAGTGAGMFLKPAEDHAPADETHAAAPEEGAADGQSKGPKPEQAGKQEAEKNSSELGAEKDNTSLEYVKLNNQFVVPVVHGSKVASLVVMSLSIEISAGQKETVFSLEPKLRDALLQVLFDHANAGGFDGTFTSGEKMRDLRGTLFEAAYSILGPIASDVLVVDIVRQDV